MIYRFGGISGGFATHVYPEDDDELAERGVQCMKEEISVKQKSSRQSRY